MRTQYLGNLPRLLFDCVIQVCVAVITTLIVFRTLGLTDKYTLVFFAALAATFVVVIDVTLLCLIAIFMSKLTQGHFYTELVWLAGAFLSTAAMMTREHNGYLFFIQIDTLFVLAWALYKLWTTELVMMGSAPYPPTKGRVTLIIFVSSAVYVWLTLGAFNSVLQYSILPAIGLGIVYFTIGITIAYGRNKRKAISRSPEPPIVDSGP